MTPPPRRSREPLPSSSLFPRSRKGRTGWSQRQALRRDSHSRPYYLSTATSMPAISRPRTPETAYGSLLQRAASVFELDGNPADRPRAYETAGLIMLANIDLLITIWDGNAAAGVGGTAQIISRAVSNGIPIIWIEPANPAAIRLSWSPTGDVPSADVYARPQETFSPVDNAEVALAVRELLALPTRPEAREVLDPVPAHQRAALEFLSLVLSAGVAVRRPPLVARRLLSAAGRCRHPADVAHLSRYHARGPVTASSDSKTSCFQPAASLTISPTIIHWFIAAPMSSISFSPRWPLQWR